MARHARFCDGIARRDFLRLGTAGVFGIGLTLPALLEQEARTAEKGKKANEVSLIFLYLHGGLSTIDTFDLKPDAPAEIRGPFRPVRTNVPGMHLTELLPTLAKMADKFALVRSLHHNRSEHSGGTNRFLTGYPSVAANLKDSEFPDVGSVVAKELEGQARG